MPANSHSQFQSIFTMSVPPRSAVNQILSFCCVLHCPGPSTIICPQFYNVPVCVLVFADNENPFLPPSKNDRWQTKGRSVFLNSLQGHQMGIIIVYVSGLPGLLGYPALPSWISPCLTHLHDGWPLRQLIGNSLIYSLPLPQSNGFISFYRHMMSKPRSL